MASPGHPGEQHRQRTFWFPQSERAQTNRPSPACQSPRALKRQEARMRHSTLYTANREFVLVHLPFDPHRPTPGFRGGNRLSPWLRWALELWEAY